MNRRSITGLLTCLTLVSLLLSASHPALAARAAATAGRHTSALAQEVAPIDPGPWPQIQPTAASDPDGQIFVMWTDFRDAAPHIRFSSMAPGEAWLPSARLDASGAGAQSDSHVGMDGQGNLYAVWLDARGAVPQVYFSHRPVGGSWQPGSAVSASADRQSSPSLAVNTRGEAVATWVQGARPNAIVMASIRSVNGVWSTAEQVAPAGGIYNTSAAMDDWGRAYVAWEDWSANQVYFSMRAPEGPWGLLELVRDDPAGKPWAPSIAVDGVGNVHAVWEDDRSGKPGVFAAYRSAGGRWSANVQVAENGWVPGVGVDAAGNAIAAWEAPNGDMYRAIRYLGGGWNEPELLVAAPPRTAAAANPSRLEDGTRRGASALGPDGIESGWPGMGGGYTFFPWPPGTDLASIHSVHSPGPCSSMMTLATHANTSGRPQQFGGGNVCRNGPQAPANWGDPGFIGPAPPPPGTQIGGWQIQTVVVDGQTVYVVDTPGTDGIYTSLSDAHEFASTYQYIPWPARDPFNLDFPLPGIGLPGIGPDPGGDPGPQQLQPPPEPQAKDPPKVEPQPLGLNQPPQPPAWAWWQWVEFVQRMESELGLRVTDFHTQFYMRKQWAEGWTPTPAQFAAYLNELFESDARRLQPQPSPAQQPPAQQQQPQTQQPQTQQPQTQQPPLGYNPYRTEENRALYDLLVGRRSSSRTDPVLLHSGEFVHTQTALSIPGRGFHYELTLTYRSQGIYEGPVGWGWRHNYDQRVVATGGGSLARQDGAGRLDEYSFDGVGFTPPVGLFTTLASDAGGVTITGRDGAVETFFPPADPTAPGALKRLADRNGNTMTFAYDAAGRLQTVTDTLGRAMTYAYDAQGFLTTVTDHMGRQVKLAYDAAGDLVSITTPAVTGTPHGNDFPQGKTTRFEYSSGFADDRLNHNLTAIISPNEVADGSLTPRTINTYGVEGLAFDRIVAQSWGGGRANASGVPAGGDLTIAYSTAIAPDDPAGAASKTTLTDRDGSVTEYWHDGAGHRLRSRQVVSGQPVVTDMTYNLHGQTTSIIYPLGNRIEYGYDDGAANRLAQGNLLTIRYVADAARGCDGLGAAPCPHLVTTMTYEPAFQLVESITDPAGRTLTNSYDARGNRTRVEYPDVTAGPAAPQTASAHWTYNAHGQPLTFTDPEGNVARYDYYAAGPAAGFRQRLTEASGDLDAVTEYEYDAAGNLSAVVDPRGVRREHRSNELNQLVAIRRDAGGLDFEIRYWYDANDNLIRTAVENVLPELDADFRPTGNVMPDAAHPWITTDIVYDLLDNRVQQREEVDATTQVASEYRYDAVENLASITSPAGNRQEFTYDERRQVIEITWAAGSAQASSTSFVYDANGNLTWMTDGEGNRTDLFYDGFDRQVGEVDALGNIRRWQLDANGNILAISQFDGQEGRNPTRLLDAPDAVLLSHAEQRFDERNRRYQTRSQYFSADLTTGALTPITSDGDGDGWVEASFSFDRNNLVVQRVDDNDNATDYGYDGLNRLATATDALGNVLAYTYDGNGNLVQMVATERQPEGLSADETYTTAFEYDALNHMAARTDPGGHTWLYRRDSRNNLILFVDANGNTTLHAYDGLNRRLSSTSHLRAGGVGGGAVIGAATTRNAYDANGNLTRFTDANGNATNFSYDALDRLVAITYADATTVAFAYDRAGNLVQNTDANGSVIAHSYDALNRRVRSDVTRGAGVGGSTRQTFAWDGLGRLIAASDNNDPADPDDDSAIARSYDSLSNLRSETQDGATVFSAYDGAGNRLSLAYPGGTTLTTTYDALNRVKTIAGGGGQLAAYDYIGPWRELRRADANGTYVEYAYDDARRLTTINYRRQADDSLITGFSVTRDAVGNILAETAQPGAVTTTYAFDSLYCLVSLQRPGLSQTFAYDAAGNRTIETRNGQTILYTVDVMNRYTRIGGEPRSYDANGNLITAGVHTYAYDAFDRLARSERALWSLHLPFVIGGGGSASGLSSASPPSQPQPASSLHSYDALDRRLRLQTGDAAVRFIYDDATAIEEWQGGAMPMATYVPGLLMQRGGQRSFYQVDAEGSVRALASAAGAVVERVDYEAFGRPLFTDGSASARGNPHLYRGLYYDAGDRLYVLGGQRYDPLTNRHLR